LGIGADAENIDSVWTPGDDGGFGLKYTRTESFPSAPVTGIDLVDEEVVAVTGEDIDSGTVKGPGYGFDCCVENAPKGLPDHDDSELVIQVAVLESQVLEYL